jgi:hypothetical protein
VTITYPSLFTPHCPNCRSIEFRRVDPVNFLERLLGWPLQPYCCELCGRRFFLFRWKSPE